MSRPTASTPLSMLGGFGDAVAGGGRRLYAASARSLAACIAVSVGDRTPFSRRRHEHRPGKLIKGALHALGEHLDVAAAVPIGDRSQVELPGV